MKQHLIIARQLLGETTFDMVATTVGMVDYYCYPKQRVTWGGPFNGQHNRQRIFKAILALLQPAAIIETGTYVGTTTEFLAQFGLPVFTVEGNPRNYGFARVRLRKWRNVSLVFGDSREALLRWFGNSLCSVTDGALFIYLDAHWYADLPLAEELDIVFKQCPAAVVMVDDFQVPDDPGYGHDDYGPGKALTVDYIAPAMERYGLVALYPATPALSESGARRGCVILARRAVGATLASLATPPKWRRPEPKCNSSLNWSAHWAGQIWAFRTLYERIRAPAVCITIASDLLAPSATPARSGLADFSEDLWAHLRRRRP